MSLYISKAAFALVLSLGSTVSVLAQYTSSSLPLPTGVVAGRAYAGAQGQQVGSVTHGFPQAMLWNGASGSAVNLNKWSYGSVAFAKRYGLEGGLGYVTKYTTIGSGKGGGGSRTYYIPHAMLWKGYATSAVDLNPTGMYESAVLGLGSTQQTGWATPVLNGPPHAYLWTGTASSAVDLNPSGFQSSQAVGMDGAEEVGYGLTTLGAYHALLWTGTAAGAVDLNPAGSTILGSYGRAIDVTVAREVGSAKVGDSTTSTLHAYMWSGTAASALDLHPAGYLSSEALAVRGAYQAGYGMTALGYAHALVWHGTAASVLDLNNFLPAGYVTSQALGIDPDGSIVGFASNGTYTYPVVWKRTTTSFMIASQDLAPNGSGWVTQGINLNLASPYSGVGTSLVWYVNGGPSNGVAGSSVTLPWPTTGNYLVGTYSQSSSGAKTPTRFYTFNIDTAPPLTVSNYSNFVLRLSATDVGSGVGSTSYFLDGVGPYGYAGPLTLSNVGHAVQFWSTDNAGNVETHHTLSIAAVPPTLTSMTPNNVLSGSGAFNLVILGGGFIPSSVVNWNGTPRTTTYVSTTQLSVSIDAADVATAGTAMVTVSNLSPGTGTSPALTFSIPQTATAIGTVGNPSGGTFILSAVTSYSGFALPSTLHVVTNSSTYFYDATGTNESSAAFFDNLEDTSKAKVIGTYSASTGTITARTVQLQ